MNIEGSNLLSMLSASDIPSTITPGSLPANGENLGFSAAFMEQLGVLQAGLADAASQGMALQNAEFSKLPADAQAAMQSFAALFGKNLPPAGKVEQPIDLDDTMQALADVMQHLQALEAPGDGSQTAIAVETASMQPAPLVSAQRQVKQQPIDVDAVVATIPSQSLPQQVVVTGEVQPPATLLDEKVEFSVVSDEPKPVEVQVQVNDEPKPVEVEVQANDQTKPVEVQVNDQPIVPVLVSVPVAVQPVAMAPQPTDNVVPLVSGDSVSLLSTPPTPRKNQIGSISQGKDNLISPHAAASDSDDFELEFERSISALLQQAGASGEQTGQEAQSGLPKGDSHVATLANAHSSSSVADKSIVDMRGELGRLSQSLPGNHVAKAAVPVVGTPVGNPAWNEDLGQKLIWMHKQMTPSAELRLNPEHLGPVLVKIDVHQDQASITFTAQHQVVRDAIEAAIPKLRDMFSAQQLQLADVNVSQHQQQSEQRQARDFFQAASEQGRGRQTNSDESLDAGVSESQDIADEIEAGRAIAGNGLLSLFA